MLVCGLRQKAVIFVFVLFCFLLLKVSLLEPLNVKGAWIRSSLQTSHPIHEWSEVQSAGHCPNTTY